MRLRSNWQPRLADQPGPPSERLAAALTEDILGGSLPPGHRLPPHRDLAFRLGIGIGTVTKAYAALERLGLVAGVHGRGTFVAGTEARPRSVVDLSVNVPPQMLGDRLLAATLATLSRTLGADSFGSYIPAAGLPEHRAALARWLAGRGLRVEPDRVILTNGAQHALSIAISVACGPSSTILTEAVTYPGAIALARHLGHRLVGLPLDEEGLRPDAVERALIAERRAGRTPVLYVTPTLQNPTGATMGEGRRRDIAALCRTHDAVIVEDDIYSAFLDDPLPALAELAPDRTLYLNGLSKTLSPGLRIGVLVPPADRMERSVAALQATCTMAPPLTCRIMEHWLTDGTAQTVAAAIRGEVARRTALARSLLPAPVRFPTPAGFHLWLPMEPAAAERFAADMAAAGVLVTPPALMAVETAGDAGGVRLCLGAPPPAPLRTALSAVAGLLDRARTSAPAMAIPV